MSEIAVSVIVPARDAAATIGRTLDAIGAQDFKDPYEVIVVDDGSRDDTVALAERAGTRVLRQEGKGPGEARNLGAREAHGTALAFTDADCFPTRHWLATGMAALEQADLVQGRVLPDPYAERGPFDHTIWVVEESGLYETANLFVSRDLYLQVGGFEDWLDVEIGKRLGEDVWFGWKARREGARTAFATDALVHHAVFPRHWREFVAERRRLVYFPYLVRKIPELRRWLLTARLFVNARSAAFAAAAASVGVVLGLAVAGAGPWSLLALGAAAPYLALCLGRTVALGRYGPKVVGIEVAADAVGFAALIRGSLGARRLVL